MTTPERLRRRQIRESIGIVLLAIGLVGAFLYFQGQADAQKRCLTNYISSNSETSAIRSDQVARESKATRRFLLNATDPERVKTREQFLEERGIYARTLRSIDAARAANPVRPFPKGVCD